MTTILSSSLLCELPSPRARRVDSRIHCSKMLSAVLKAVYTSAKLDPKWIDDIMVGNVLPAGELLCSI